MPWEHDKVSFIYDSKPGPEYFTFPMTGLLPVNIVDPIDLKDAPSPLWITYIPQSSIIGKLDSKGDRTYIINLPTSFEAYIQKLSYDDRKEMKYVLRKNSSLRYIENKKEDLFKLCDEYFDEIVTRSISEGEVPFSQEGIQNLKKIYSSEVVHTISIYQEDRLLGVNISFRKNGIVYDSVCIRDKSDEVRKLSIGTVAVLKNIEFSIRDGFQVYDMLTGDWGYKTKFGASPVQLKHYIKCSLEFAEYYGIPIEEISEIE